jgi:hypothetical protein
LDADCSNAAFFQHPSGAPLSSSSHSLIRSSREPVVRYTQIHWTL